MMGINKRFCNYLTCLIQFQPLDEEMLQTSTGSVADQERVCRIEDDGTPNSVATHTPLPSGGRLGATSVSV